MLGDVVGAHMKKAVFGLVLLLCSRAVPALAEIDISGSWASINHEDALERGGGPYRTTGRGFPSMNRAVPRP